VALSDAGVGQTVGEHEIASACTVGLWAAEVRRHHIGARAQNEEGIGDVDIAVDVGVFRANRVAPEGHLFDSNVVEIPTGNGDAAGDAGGVVGGGVEGAERQT